MRNSRAVFLILCLLAVGLIAACGDDDNGDGGGSTEEFIAEADDICIGIAEESAARDDVLPTTAEEAVPYLEASLKRSEDNLAAFEDLGAPPAEIEADWNEVMDLREQRLSTTRELLKLARRGVAAAAPEYQEVVGRSSDLDEQENKILEELGSTACAEVLPPDERREVIKLVTFWETQPLDDCRKYTTDEGIELGFGSLAACQEAQENPPPEGFTKQVNVTHVEGVEGVTASVDASLKGGIGDGQDVTYEVVFVDGRWKVDSATLQAG